jgi:beta-lactamase regulating signal transducer with metallopeptidase domain
MNTLLQAALVNALQATLLALVVAPLARFCRPAVAHVLWLLVLLKLITPPLWVVSLPADWFAPRQQQPDAAIDPAVAAPEEVPVPGSREQPEPVIEASPPVSTPAFSFPEVDWTGLVAGAWLLGSLAWWSLAGWRLGRLWRLLSSFHPAPAEVQQRARRLAERLGSSSCPVVYLVPATLSPLVLVLGWSARVLFPRELWNRLDEQQRDALLLHELGHLRRGDHHVRRLELLVLGLYWWHPVVWWAHRALQEAEEQCCDALVVGTLAGAGPAYANGLIETVAFLSRGRSVLPAGASGAGRVPLLKRRLTMILNGTASRALSPAWRWGLLLGGLLLLPWLPAVARTAPEPTTPATTDPQPVAIDLAHEHAVLGKVVYDLQQCARCHQESPKVVLQGTYRSTHDRIVKLLDEMQAQRQRLRQTEDQLTAALKALQQEQERADAHRRAEKRKAFDDYLGAKKEQPEDRLRELDRKLENLLREVEQLRKELKSAPPRSRSGPTGGGASLAPPGGEPDRNTAYINRRTFRLPIQIQKGTELSSVELWVTSDKGGTFTHVGRIGPKEEQFTWTAPADGHYGFAVHPRRSGDSDRRDPPLRSGDLNVLQNVIVDTMPPHIKLWTMTRGGRRLLAWEIREDNPNLSSFRLTRRLPGETEWQSISLVPRLKGEIECPPEKAEVHLKMADLAGNVGETQITVPELVR